MLKLGRWLPSSPDCCDGDLLEAAEAATSSEKLTTTSGGNGEPIAAVQLYLPGLKDVCYLTWCLSDYIRSSVFVAFLCHTLGPVG